MWEESPDVKTPSRGHQRQVFLFKDCVILCKPRRDASMNTDTYAFKNKMKVNKERGVNGSSQADENLITKININY